MSHSRTHREEPLTKGPVRLGVLQPAQDEEIRCVGRMRCEAGPPRRWPLKSGPTSQGADSRDGYPTSHAKLL
ncbi:hypothetical protein FHR84_003522 [Actinopolyspora biskrensis]|uniref:Uncharacterized protein n=1 Tax=Actinopolyspora biskrensis TaxID=1470178 RepID=A0A852ZDV9_9ACTN|nr:hypothetical protein [Actinopolyspora biskrensis]